MSDYKQRMLSEFAARKDGDTEAAQHIINRVIWLGHYSARVCDFDNDAVRYNERTSERMNARLDRLTKELKRELEAYDADVAFYGIYPTIVDRGTTREIYSINF